MAAPSPAPRRWYTRLSQMYGSSGGSRAQLGAGRQQGPVGGQQVRVRQAQVLGVQQQELPLQVMEADPVVLHREQAAGREPVQPRRACPARRRRTGATTAALTAATGTTVSSG